MRVLVTGGAGFIGSHMVDAYVNAGHDVVVIDNLASGKREHLNPKATFVMADITDSKKVNETFVQYGPFDFICHLAAQKSVTDSAKDPIYDAKTNILGSLTILEAARKHQVKSVLFSSTGGALYGETDNLPISENAPISPAAPYGIAKYSIEHYLRFYNSLGIKTLILRYGNVYGPRQDPYGEAGVAAIFSLKIHAKEPMVIYGDGEQTRDFIYIEDVVQANLLAQKFGQTGTWNIGSGIETSINQIAKQLNVLAEQNGLQAQEILYEKPRLGEIRRNALSIQKANQELNWQPKWTLEDGLKKTLESFK